MRKKRYGLKYGFRTFRQSSQAYENRMYVHALCCFKEESKKTKQ